MLGHAISLVVLLLVMGIAGCGGDSSDDRRTAFVEVTTSPSGLPVEIQVNNTTVNGTTPVVRNVRYDSLCSPGGLSPGDLDDECLVVGTAFLRTDDRGARVTLCLTDRGKRVCESGDEGFVVVSL
jgi:hypothetical protein